jgi:two-component system phosphate regulon sensor histidine kinase PhoR
MSSWVPPRRLIVATVALAMPALVALLVLAALNQLAAGAAILSGTVILVAMGVLVRPHLEDLLAVLAYVDGLTRGNKARPPRLGQASTVTGLASAVGRLQRSWAQKSEELEHLSHSSEAILDSLPDPLLLLDGSLVIARGNAAARALFGPNLEGRPLAAVLRDPGILEAAQSVAAGSESRTVELHLTGRVGRVLRARIEAMPGAAEPAAILTLHDLTTLKRTEQMRADFVANASHELRTPLSTLIGFIETLSGTVEDDQAARARFLAIMHEQATRMSRLVSDLLSLSRIELNEHSRPTGRVQLARLLSEVADSLELKARDKDMSINISTELFDAVVVGDGEELTQVFQNLIDNAVKYGLAGTAIEVSVVRDTAGPPLLGKPSPGGVVSVRVQDRGDGIAREHLPRLTERFYRIDAARSREMGGTGLGLAIVKHIVNHHRGALAIDSTVDEGSSFTVHLPGAPD